MLTKFFIKNSIVCNITLNININYIFLISIIDNLFIFFIYKNIHLYFNLK